MIQADSPVVLFANGIGDHLLNLPALRALTRLFPHRVTLISDMVFSRIFFRELDVNRLCELPMRGSKDGREFDADCAAGVIQQCDLLLSLNPWHSPSVDRLLALLKPKQSIGFFSAFDIALERDFGKHSADLAFDVPRRLDSSLNIEDFSGPPLLAQEYTRWAKKIRNGAGDCRVMTLHTDTSADKMWQVESYVAVLEQFLASHPEFVVFHVRQADGLRIDSGDDCSHIIPCTDLPLPIALSLVAESDFFLGIDSCMLHMADLCRVPGVGLFGPTSSTEWGFRFGPGRHVEGGRCMESIRVEAVLRAIDSLVCDVRRHDQPSR